MSKWFRKVLELGSLRRLGYLLLGFAALVGLFSCSRMSPGGGGAGQATDGGGRFQWVDVHVHLIGGAEDEDFAGAAYAAVAAMNEAGIKKSIVMPPPQISGMPHLYDYESFLPALKRSPGRFAFLGGGGSLNPMIQEAGGKGKIGEEIRRKFAQRAEEILKKGALGFGEVTAHHLSFATGHPYESVPADHSLLLLLADIAARDDVVIDLHLDPVTEWMNLPGRLLSPPNPPVLEPNVEALERLLAHNRGAKIVWAHAGSDPLGHWTVSLSRNLLQRHPNLYMSLRLGGGVPRNLVLDAGGEIKPEWLRLFRDFPDRFVIGGDQFIPSSRVRGSGPGLLFAQRAPLVRERTRTFLSRLPADLRQKIAYENAMHLYNLSE